MAWRSFEMFDVVEVLQHWYSGRSKTDVATSLGVDRGTVRKYVRLAEAAGGSPAPTQSHVVTSGRSRTSACAASTTRPKTDVVQLLSPVRSAATALRHFCSVSSRGPRDPRSSMLARPSVRAWTICAA